MKLKTSVSYVLMTVLLLGLVPQAAFAEPPPTKIFLVGDSTVCYYESDPGYKVTRAGWGVYLDSYFDLSKAKVINYALSGRSSKSFTEETNYTDHLLNEIGAGDYLFIQFGHNDEKTEDPKRFTDPTASKETEGSFKWYLYQKYILMAQEKGAHPVLVTPVSRRASDGSVTDSHGVYDDAVRALAAEVSVPYIDLTAKSEALLSTLYKAKGADGTKALFSIKNDDSVDNTHFNNAGAKEMCALVFGGIKELNLPLMQLLKPEKNKPVSVYLAGDSTVKTYVESGIIAGWGQYIGHYLKDATVINKAEGGRSSRSFINEGRLDNILSEIKEGDYLFIQFGHNDSADIKAKDTANRYSYKLERSVALGVPVDGVYPSTPIDKVNFSKVNVNEFKINAAYLKGLQDKKTFPYQTEYYPYEITANDKVTRGTYKWYLSQYVEGALKKGAKPIIVTPVARREFEKGKIKHHHYDKENKNYDKNFPNDGYVDAAIQVAKQYDIPYIDLYTETKQLYESLGDAKSVNMQTYKTNGEIDNTHYSKYGAFTVAGLLAEQIRGLNIELSNHVTPPDMKAPAFFTPIAPPTAKAAIQSDKVWNFRTGAFANRASMQFVDEDTVIDNLHLVAGKNMKLELQPKKQPTSTSGIEKDLTGALYIHNASYTNRIEIPVKGPCTITVYAEGATNRDIVFGDGPVATELSKEPLAGAGQVKPITYVHEGGPDTLCIYTNGGDGVYIYQIELAYATNTSK